MIEFDVILFDESSKIYVFVNSQDGSQFWWFSRSFQIVFDWPFFGSIKPEVDHALKIFG